MDQDVGRGVFGRDIQALIFDPLRQELPDVALASPDVEHRVARLRLRELLREPIADAFLAPIAPPDASAVELGQLLRGDTDAFCHAEKLLREHV